jgi:glutaminyl-peptide cyclotransferase
VSRSSPGPLVSLALALLLLAGGGHGDHARGAGAIPSFHGDEAQRWIVRQCALGPRVPGTSAHAAWLRLVRAYLDSLDLPVREERFRLACPPGLKVKPAVDSLDLTNLVASVRPGLRPRLLLGAHWDSRPWADQDPVEANHTRPVSGANDGASGVAILLTLARIMKESPPSLGVDLAFFDAEDLGRPDKPEEFCQGSKWMAEHWPEPLPDWVVVLDMVGSENLEIGRELYSWGQSPGFLDLIFRLARDRGFQEWNWETQYAVVDDHLSFQRIGVPAVDLVGFNDPVWHTRNDEPNRTSPRVLGRVGEVVSALIYGGYLAPE